MEGETPNYKASPLGKGVLLLSHNRPTRSPAITPYETPPSPNAKPHYRQTQNLIIAPYKQREPAKK